MSFRSFPKTLMPIGVRIPVVSMSTRALMGIVQAFWMPGRSSALDISSTSLSLVIPDLHAAGGLSMMTVSIMESGPGSVGVSARPALPKTRSTSGNLRRIPSWAWTSRLASSMEMPGTVMGMKRMEPSSSGGMNSDPSLLQG